MFREFLGWWTGNLVDLVPPRWRASNARVNDGLVVAPAGPLEDGVEAAQVRLRHNGRETVLGEFPLSSSELRRLPRPAGKPVVLQLAEPDVLSTTVALPLSAEPDLEQILVFEMDRETPFRPEDIFWSHRVVSRDLERGLLSVRLMLVPRANLDGLLARLNAAGIVPAQAEIGGGPDQGFYLPLRDHSAKEPAQLRHWRWPIVACCVALGLGVILVPFLRQNSELNELDQKISLGRQARTDAERLRKEVIRLQDSLNLIDIEREAAGRPIATLAILTRLLPTDSYLLEYRQQQHVITSSGRSTSTSRLISALATSDRLRDPSLAAPVMRVDGSKTEAFVIRAEIKP
jgi:general secretion pathway protein L